MTYFIKIYEVEESKKICNFLDVALQRNFHVTTISHDIYFLFFSSLFYRMCIYPNGSVLIFGIKKHGIG